MGLNDEEEFLQFLLVLNKHLGLAAGVKLSGLASLNDLKNVSNSIMWLHSRHAESSVLHP